MTSLYDKLNLRPNERRLVTIVAIVVFILLNAFFVWPEFGEWGRLQRRKREATALLKAYQTEVDNTARYQKQFAELQQAGAAIASEEQASKFATTVNNQASLSGVQVVNQNFGGRQASALGKTNQFFDEQRGTITVTTEEKALVDFLYNLGVGGSLVRVRNMSLNTDGPRQRLLGNLTLVASFAKRAPTRTTSPAGTSTRTNLAPMATANPRSTNTGLRPNLTTAQATNVSKATSAAPGLMQRLKNWTTAASRSNAPAKK